MQVCQKTTSEPVQTYDIADANTEEMWVEDGNVYVYYKGPENRWHTCTANKSVLVILLWQNHWLRETFIRLTCDKKVKEPIMTTEGDFGHFFTYVCLKHACMCLIWDPDICSLDIVWNEPFPPFLPPGIHFHVMPCLSRGMWWWCGSWLGRHTPNALVSDYDTLYAWYIPLHAVWFLA